MRGRKPKERDSYLSISGMVSVTEKGTVSEGERQKAWRL